MFRRTLEHATASSSSSASAGGGGKGKGKGIARGEFVALVKEHGTCRRSHPLPHGSPLHCQTYGGRSFSHRCLSAPCPGPSNTTTRENDLAAPVKNELTTMAIFITCYNI